MADDAKYSNARERIAEKLQTQERGKLPKPSRRVMVSLTEDQFHHLHDLAFRACSSPSALGRLAILNLLVDAETGKIPLLVELDGGKPRGQA